VKEGEMSTKQKLNSDEQARIGRPIKEARKGKRSRISVDISSTSKALIASRAKASGRTLAREAEIMIEGFVRYLEMMERTRMTLEDMDKGKFSVEAALWRLGYTPVRVAQEDKAWKIWAEPGFPGVERSGFVPFPEVTEPPHAEAAAEAFRPIPVGNLGEQMTICGKPVAMPLPRARLSTKPAATGSVTFGSFAITIGTVLVAACRGSGKWEIAALPAGQSSSSKEALSQSGHRFRLDRERYGKPE
jgi:hypothetical protein